MSDVRTGVGAAELSFEPSSRQNYWARVDLAGRAVVVFGGGGAALRHVGALLHAAASVTVISREAEATVDDLAGRGLLTWEQREFDEGDLEHVWLAIAATEVATVDGRIARACEQRRLWCIRESGGEHHVSGVGRVTLVGGGPGDPGLMTIAGLDALRAADVVVADRLAPLSVLAGLGPAVKIIDVGKVPFGKATPQERINRILIEHAQAGNAVVRFKGGDSFLFGRGGEELIACVAAGVPVSVIPGVTSAFAVPACAGIPVTHRGVTQGVTVVSGHVPPDDPASTVDYEALARCGTTLVFLMAVSTLPAIAEALLGYGMAPETAAVTIADGTLAQQRTVRGTLSTIAKDVAVAGLMPPAITVIGSVADFDPAAMPHRTSPDDPSTAAMIRPVGANSDITSR
ncbi:uroporphyrinogen-III C-methyltransferase [Candidatus Mycolicibacterium alkanivorans]|uniref:Uroporphyrinogen-III C-methyltransferase n=1 Tax=Candidatus Mycolicibacterium alkanivorans TaxID=2954114 RepID=A0ABS9YX58_9MYCO|nr:uroporphyrinogen-III C-methyltransferase [Candidatus Mycolicibacterium alkanivorans]MCI4675821.1 uroporphyrinogen-III C-methyltransferase [Candidatus Mycolicibacterium alkanivorans]